MAGAVTRIRTDDTRERRVLGQELLLVLALSLGASAVSALISLVGSLTARQRLAHQAAVLVPTYAPGRPLLDLTWQVFTLTTALVPVLLVGHLLTRGGESWRTMGFDVSRPAVDAARGAAVALVVGGTGLGLYLGAHALGINLTVVPARLPDVWWRIPVLIAYAIQNAVLEETIVLGYLTGRLGRLGWPYRRATIASSLLRGAYHLYQGFGGFVGNAAMGVIFCHLYRRWGRIAPLVVAHTLIDTVAFVGAALLLGHVAWLPAA